jgi:thiol-disulfide isomerase/thioredoxin
MLTRILESTANATTVLAGLALSYLVAAHLGWVAVPSRAAPSGPASRYVQGEAVGALDGVDYGRADKTILIVFRSTCGYCIRSAPFYQELVERRNKSRSPVRIVAVAPASDDKAPSFPELQGWSPDYLARFQPGEFRIVGVPTVLIVDRQGRVQASWMGELSATEKEDVISIGFGV